MYNEYVMADISGRYLCLIKNAFIEQNKRSLFVHHASHRALITQTQGVNWENLCLI
jgi:hypothetical protein